MIFNIYEKLWISFYIVIVSIVCVLLGGCEWGIDFDNRMFFEF